MEWHYDDSGTPAGPVDESRIAELAKSGKVLAETLVWNETMPGWKPVRDTELAKRIRFQSSSPPVLPRKTGDHMASVPTVYPESAYMKPRFPLRSPNCAWWSLLVAGVGHILLGQEKKGLLLLFVSEFVIPLLVYGLGLTAEIDPSEMGGVEMTCFVLQMIVAVIAIVDGRMVGNCLRQGRRVRHWQWFPTAEKTIPDEQRKIGRS